jgi:hypothetical protein
MIVVKCLLSMFQSGKLKRWGSGEASMAGIDRYNFDREQEGITSGSSKRKYMKIQTFGLDTSLFIC